MMRRFAPRAALAIAAAASAVSVSNSYPGNSHSIITWSNPRDSSRLWFNDDGPMADVFTAGQGLLRSSRAIYTFAANSLDYKISLMGHDEKSNSYFDARDKVHTRAANRLLRLCETNRGFYIKAGQFIASMQHMPKEFVTTLSALQDKASFWPFKAMERVFQEEFGRDVTVIYKEFDEQPIAAASLAQVHCAYLKDGQKVAVKVQYPGLQQQFGTDIATMAFLSKAVAWLFPDYQLEWLVPEFEKNIVRELDFIHEADNADRTAKSFAHKQGVRVPHIVRELTTRKVLTMEFMEGCKVDDVDSLEKAGIDPKQVASLLVDVFAEMIFCHGYVHGDPHPGNILVHKHPSRSGKNNFDLVLLDHGLYRELDENFRSNYCRLWRALILLDPDEIQQAGRNLGAGEFARYLPVIFTGRVMTSKTSFGQTMTPDEQKKLKEEVRRFTLGDISQWLEGLDREFLTVLRTDGLVRSIANKLGATRKTRLMSYVKYAVTGLALGHPGEPSFQEQGWLSYTKAKLDYARLRIHIEVFEVLLAAHSWYAGLSRHFVGFWSNFTLGGFGGSLLWTW